MAQIGALRGISKKLFCCMSYNAFSRCQSVGRIRAGAGELTKRTIFDAVRWFMVKNENAIDSKKMQNLSYYAQTRHYALHDEYLFNGGFSRSLVAHGSNA